MGLSPEEGVDQIDLEEMPSLQYMQMTIPQFCAAILEKSLPLLNMEDEVIVTEVFQLLHRTLDIIVDIVTPDLWQDQSMAARECVCAFSIFLVFLR